MSDAAIRAFRALPQDWPQLSPGSPISAVCSDFVTSLPAQIWVGEIDPLTGRESQVLRLTGEGKASRDIATELGLSNGTVRNYLSDAISKLGAAIV